MLSLVLCVVCLVFVWLIYARARDSTAHALPPAFPGALPLVGHTLLLINPSTLWNLFKNAAEDCVKQGGVTHAKIGMEIYYLIVDPQDALTAANSCMQKHFGFDFGKVWVGDGLLTSTEELWKRHRKLLNPAFTLPVIHGFLEVFNDQSKRLVSEVEPHVGKGLFDHTVNLKNIALETLCVGTFGINAIDDKTFTKKYMKAVDVILKMLTSRVTKFWLQSDLIYKLSGLKEKETELADTLNAMADKVMQQKKAAMKDKASNNSIEYETTGIKYRPFLDLLLELSANGALTDKEIREEMHTIIAAGFETTSNQLTFILLQLGANPEIQEKVYEELLEVLGPERDVEKDDVNKLIYTNAVIMESLRVFPSVPALLRYVDKDVRLKNYTMRAGSECFIFPLATHLDPAWGAESDQFKPERWLNNDVRNNKEFAAFGLGKRACIGRTYAMISMKVTLAHFLRRYRVKADMNKLHLKYDFVLKADSGHEISIESRT